MPNHQPMMFLQQTYDVPTTYLQCTSTYLLRTYHVLITYLQCSKHNVPMAYLQPTYDVPTANL